jgi:SanA protein
MKKIFITLLFSFLTIIGIVFTVNIFMLFQTKDLIRNNASDVTSCDVMLVLGTSKSINGRTLNPYFVLRLEAAAELFFKGKVKHILVSGDNSTSNYNEPRDMRNYLLGKGIPDSCITMDFAGLRTLDSVVRSKEIFNQTNLVIISQRYHLHRALFLAHKKGINATGFVAKQPIGNYSKMLLREYFARVKAILDLYILDTQPKYLGIEHPIRV